MFYHIDGKDQVVGRLATMIVRILTGKHRPHYDPSVPGDAVIVTNAHLVQFTGKKFERKLYSWHTGYPGGLRQATPSQLVVKKAERDGMLWRAVWGMLPRNRMRKEHMRRLKLYAREDHPHHGISAISAIPPHLLPKARPGSDVPAEQVFADTPGFVVHFERGDDGSLRSIHMEPQHADRIPKKPAKGTGLMTRGSQPAVRSALKPAEELAAFAPVMDVLQQQRDATAAAVAKETKA